jgi:hypothetical protein
MGRGRTEIACERSQALWPMVGRCGRVEGAGVECNYCTAGCEAVRSASSIVIPGGMLFGAGGVPPRQAAPPARYISGSGNFR